MDCHGRSGGLAILWRNSVNCSIIGYSQNFVNMEIIDNNKGVWRLIGFYGYPERARRKLSWDLIRSLATVSPVPWCILGDFNNLLGDDEKRGGATYPTGSKMALEERWMIVGWWRSGWRVIHLLGPNTMGLLVGLKSALIEHLPRLVGGIFSLKLSY